MALCVVACLAALVAGVYAIQNRMQYLEETGGTAPRAAKAGAGSPSAVRRAILEHSFWRTRVSSADLDMLVATIRRCRAGEYVWVDDHFHVVVDPEGDDKSRPEGVGRRSFYIKVAWWTGRPDEAQILDRFRRELDEAQFFLPKD
jgi:hypothetical protein